MRQKKKSLISQLCGLCPWCMQHDPSSWELLFSDPCKFSLVFLMRRKVYGIELVLILILLEWRIYLAICLFLSGIHQFDILWLLPECLSSYGLNTYVLTSLLWSPFDISNEFSFYQQLILAMSYQLFLQRRLNNNPQATGEESLTSHPIHNTSTLIQI